MSSLRGEASFAATMAPCDLRASDGVGGVGGLIHKACTVCGGPINIIVWMAGWAPLAALGAEAGTQWQIRALGTYQHASNSRVDGEPVEGEWSGVGEISLATPLGPGSWGMQIEGSTTPASRGVSAFFPEANGSVGETLTEKEKGRVAIVQAHYSAPAWGGLLRFGLMDQTEPLDTNPVANDEFHQFLGISFINNLSIDFPSNALGISFSRSLFDELGYTLLLSSSVGLEQGSASYADTFNVFEDGKGAFAAAQANGRWLDLDGHIGVWLNSGSRDTLSEPLGKGRSQGIYSNLSGPLGAAEWNIRLGWADEDRSVAANFAAVALTYPLGSATLGAGVGRTGVSEALAGPSASIQQAEVFVAFRLPGGVSISPDLQYLDNSGFDPRVGRTWLFAVRLLLEPP